MEATISPIGRPVASISESSQYMVGVEAAYQYDCNATFDYARINPSYLIGTMEHVENEYSDPIPLNQLHAFHAWVGGFGTIMANTTLFENEVAVRYGSNLTNDEDKDDDTVRWL